jgi:hypothetical protein
MPAGRAVLGFVESQVAASVHHARFQSKSETGIGLGDRERALDYLERAYASDSQWMGWLKNDRMFDPPRSEPRFVALMRKLRFDN